MVLIAASICTKSGKVIVSRQFVEMTKSRIEGLLAAFPKLVSGDKQHTFIETDSVRYVYQPMDKIYMLLITTKASNILEDLETLRLFSRVIPEYCRNMDEHEICENAFNLIFAFDEIVALGYRETVNLAQIRTFVEMDSHEEKVYQAVRQTQEREARNKMREKAKELQRQKMESNKKGAKPTYTSFSGSSMNYISAPAVVDSSIQLEIKSSPFPSSTKSNVPAKSLKLGSKSKNVESFVDQLKSEGEVVTINNKTDLSKNISSLSISDMEAVHLKLEERLLVSIKKDGGINFFELHGILTLRISNENWGKIYVSIDKGEDRGIQIQTHPNIDKDLFKTKLQIKSKNPAKPFPINTDVGVLKWRLQTTDEDTIPLLISCWPSDNGDGGCDVTIEYELLNVDMELNNVAINIPIPVGSHVIVSECTGDYNLETKSILLWSLPILDSTNQSGSLEFSITSCVPTDIYPINVDFSSNTSYSKIKIVDINLIEDNTPVKFSQEITCCAEKYEVV